MSAQPTADSAGADPKGLAVLVTGAPEGPGKARLRAAFSDAGVTVAAVHPDEGEEAVRRAVRQAPPGRSVVVLTDGDAASVAVRAASTEVNVQGMVLHAPRLDDEAHSLLAEWPGLQTLMLASPDDRTGLAHAVTAYRHATVDASELVVLPAAGQEPLGTRIARWALTAALAVQRQDVVLETEDGWEIHGTLSRPTAPQGLVPGVVLLHSGRSDRAIFWQFQRLLARASMAVLNIDWRGRGLSTNRGTYFELSSEERALAWRDARAAVGHLRSLPEVQPDRIALVGVVHGAEHAVGAAVGDPGIRALALLTGFMPRSDEERAVFTSGRVAVYSVTCEGHGPVTPSMRTLHEQNPHPQRRLRVYPGGAIGYQLFELDERLEGDVAGWLEEVLGP